MTGNKLKTPFRNSDFTSNKNFDRWVSFLPQDSGAGINIGFLDQSVCRV